MIPERLSKRSSCFVACLLIYRRRQAETVNRSNNRRRVRKLQSEVIKQVGEDAWRHMRDKGRIILTSPLQTLDPRTNVLTLLRNDVLPYIHLHDREYVKVSTPGCLDPLQ